MVFVSADPVVELAGCRLWTAPCLREGSGVCCGLGRGVGEREGCGAGCREAGRTNNAGVGDCAVEVGFAVVDEIVVRRVAVEVVVEVAGGIDLVDEIASVVSGELARRGEAEDRALIAGGSRCGCWHEGGCLWGERVGPIAAVGEGCRGDDHSLAYSRHSTARD